jgi:hypothetical protein
MNGITARALGPTADGSIGTSRQPSTRWPSSAMTSSSTRSHAARAAGAGGRKTMPTP